MRIPRNTMNKGEGRSKMAASPRRNLFVGLVGGLAVVGLAASAAWAKGEAEIEAEAVPALPAACSVSGTVLECSNACDVLIAEENIPAGVATIRLTGPDVHPCNPLDENGQLVFDAAGELAQGNGISIEANDVTLDLNGRSIHSTEDVAAIGEAQGLDVENAGVAIGGTGVTVTNYSSIGVSTVDNFTANFDLSTRGDAGGAAFRGMLIDHDENPTTDTVYNLVGGDAHGGGAMAIDRSHHFTIDTVKLQDTTGDNGMDLKRCTGGKILITHSHIEGRFTGLRVRNCEGVTVSNSTLTGSEAEAGGAGAGAGVELRKVKGSTFTSNTIKNNGVGIGFLDSESITIAGNTFANNSICDVEFDADSENTTIGAGQIGSDGSLLPNGTFSEEAQCLGGLGLAGPEAEPEAD